MKREFLEGFGLDKDAVDKILDENSRDIGREKQKAEQAREDLKTAQEQLAQRGHDLEDLRKTAGDADAQKKAFDELQARYDKDTQTMAAKLADREYADAVTAALAGEKVTFTSKGAEKAVRDALMADRLTLKDGQLEGFADRLKALKEADPEAFAGEKPAPRFTAPTGMGTPGPGISRAAQLSAQYNQNLYGKVRES